jgi:hypothetical protein
MLHAPGCCCGVFLIIQGSGVDPLTLTPTCSLLRMAVGAVPIHMLYIWLLVLSLHTYIWYALLLLLAAPRRYQARCLAEFGLWGVALGVKG